MMMALIVLPLAAALVFVSLFSCAGSGRGVSGRRTGGWIEIFGEFMRMHLPRRAMEGYRSICARDSTLHARVKGDSILLQIE
jgi:hypothetical protein